MDALAHCLLPCFTALHLYRSYGCFKPFVSTGTSDVSP